MSRFPPVIATNLAGTIQVSAEGFKSQYTDKIFLECGMYKVNFKRALPHEGEELPRIEADDTLHYQGQIYTKLPDNPSYFVTEDASFLILKVEISPDVQRKQADAEGEQFKYYLGRCEENAECE